MDFIFDQEMKELLEMCCRTVFLLVVQACFPLVKYLLSTLNDLL